MNCGFHTCRPAYRGFARIAATVRNVHTAPPRCWGEVFGDDVVAAAMIDRLVHHAEVISLKGDSYRLRNRGDLGRIPAAKHDT